MDLRAREWGGGAGGGGRGVNNWKSSSLISDILLRQLLLNPNAHNPHLPFCCHPKY